MTATFAVGAGFTRADIPVLCADLALLLSERRAAEVVVDVTRARADVVTVEAVTRLRLIARRHGSQVVVAGAGPDLLGLFDLLGLGDPGES